MTDVLPAHDERLRQPARIRSLQLGDTTLTYVPDGAVQLGPAGWLPDTTEAVWAAHPEYLDASGNLVGSLGGLLVERGGRALLIDAGFGPQPVPAVPGSPIGAIQGGGLLDSLAALGRDPAAIEAVAFTHLHTDHLGWAWHPAPGTGIPAFTGAAYLVAAPEWEQRELAEAEGTTREILTVLAPRVRTVADSEEIFPGVQVRVTGGHTAGHTAYLISAGEQQVIAFGDALHSPIQIAHPEWSAVNDHDRNLAVARRRALVTELAQPGTIGFGVHFADVVFGRVGIGGDQPSWQPVPTDGPSR
jgi:glyoxylase-like metal-dependent hydrolase (beta-lactamase superfamily II)